MAEGGRLLRPRQRAQVGPHACGAGAQLLPHKHLSPPGHSLPAHSQPQALPLAAPRCPPGDPQLKATLTRLRRLTEAYSAELLDAYAERAVAMGRALGLDPDRFNGGLGYMLREPTRVARAHGSGRQRPLPSLPPPSPAPCTPAPLRPAVFTEAEIRASLVFQLSKLSSMLIKVRAGRREDMHGRPRAGGGGPPLCACKGRGVPKPTARSPPLGPPPQAANTCAGGSPWDVVMAGDAEGVLLRVPRLEPGCLDAAGGKVGAGWLGGVWRVAASPAEARLCPLLSPPTHALPSLPCPLTLVPHAQDAVLLVASASGDEEVAALGRNLKGIILQQDLPHLSHLGGWWVGGVCGRVGAQLADAGAAWWRTVDAPSPLSRPRRRAHAQEGVAFVTCEDGEAVSAAVDPLMGSRVRLHAGADGVSITSTSGGGGAASSNGAGAGAAAQPVARAGKVQKVAAWRWCRCRTPRWRRAAPRPRRAASCCAWRPRAATRRRRPS